MRWIALVVSIFAVSAVGAQAQTGTEILRNSNFAQGSGTAATSWGTYGSGYTWISNGGYGATAGIRAGVGSTVANAGASQVLSPNRTMAPLVVTGRSKASTVSGAADAHYSLKLKRKFVQLIEREDLLTDIPIPPPIRTINGCIYAR